MNSLKHALLTKLRAPFSSLSLRSLSINEKLLSNLWQNIKRAVEVLMISIRDDKVKPQIKFFRLDSLDPCQSASMLLNIFLVKRSSNISIDTLSLLFLFCLKEFFFDFSLQRRRRWHKACGGKLTKVSSGFENKTLF